MEFIIETDIKKCEKLWNKYSTHSLIWEEWGVVFSLFSKSKEKPYFIHNDKGLLPLWYDTEEKTYYFFGGSYPEDKTFWFDINYFDDFMSAFNGEIKLFYINKKVAHEIIDNFPKYKDNFHNDENHYFLNSKKLDHSIENYLKMYNKKHRKNFLNDMKKFESMTVEIRQSEMEYFNIFTKYNADKFGDESDFAEEEFSKIIKKFFTYLSGKKMLTAVVIKNEEKKVIAIEYGTLFKDVYYVINGGYDHKIKNLGKYLMFEQIKYAMSTKASIIDFLSGSPGCWKELWKFECEPYYDFRFKN